jgi:segregation and condensation protein B
MDFTPIKSVIEGLLFVSGDEGIEAKQLAHILELDKGTVVDVLEDMKADFKREYRGIQIVEVAGSYQLTTLQEHAPYFEKLAYSPSHSTLSQAALETLAIVAYRQPITRAEVEEIRGVKCERAITTLTNKTLIKEVGRAEGTGRAILYGTTKDFLEYFGLRHLDDLPPLTDTMDIEQVKEEADLFFSK